VCDFCFTGYNAFTYQNLDVKTLVADLQQSMNVNAMTQSLMPDQVLVVSTTNGVPIRTISASSINEQLFDEWKTDFTKFIKEGGQVVSQPKVQPKTMHIPANIIKPVDNGKGGDKEGLMDSQVRVDLKIKEEGGLKEDDEFPLDNVKSLPLQSSL